MEILQLKNATNENVTGWTLTDIENKLEMAEERVN